MSRQITSKGFVSGHVQERDLCTFVSNNTGGRCPEYNAWVDIWNGDSTTISFNGQEVLCPVVLALLARNQANQNSI